MSAVEISDAWGRGDLPDEIVELIITFVTDWPVVRSVALTCKLFNFYAQPLLAVARRRRELLGKTHYSVGVCGHEGAGKSSLLARIVDASDSPDKAYVARAIKAIRSGDRNHRISLPHEMYGVNVGKNVFSFKDLKPSLAGPAAISEFISECDICMLVVSVELGVFETQFNVSQPVKQHSLIAFTMGVKQLIVVFTKTDLMNEIDCSARIKYIQSELGVFLSKVGFGPKAVQYIAGSSLEIQPQQQQEGQTATKYGSFAQPGNATRESNGDMLSGRVTFGEFEVSEKTHTRIQDVCSIIPRNIPLTFREILFHQIPVPRCQAGDVITFRVNRLPLTEEELKTLPGCVIGEFPPNYVNVQDHEMQCIILDCFGTPIVPLAKYFLHCNGAHSPFVFTKLISIMDKRTGKTTQDNPPSFKTGEAGICSIHLEEPIYVTPFAEFPSYGRLSITDAMDRTVAVAVIRKT